MPGLSTLDAELHQAIIGGSLADVISLHKKGADIHAQGKQNGKTALHLAAKHQHFNIVYYLLVNGADVNIKNDRGETPLSYALVDEDEVSHKIGLLLLKHGADVNITFWAEHILFSIVSSTSHGKMSSDVLKLVLAKGADIHAIRAETKETVLHQAAWLMGYLSNPIKPWGNPSLETITILLAFQANPAAKDRYDKTPLDALHRPTHILKNILEAKKLLTKKNKPLALIINEDEIYKTIDELMSEAQKVISECQKAPEALSQTSRGSRQSYEQARLFWIRLEAAARVEQANTHGLATRFTQKR